MMIFFGKIVSWIRRIYRSLFKIKSFSDIIVDDLGVPIIVYRDIAGPQRNPVAVCNFALKYYEEGDEKSFLNCANWLVDNLSHKGAFSVWEYKFPCRIYGLKAPWVSGMAQGLGIEVLVLAHKITSDDKFINAARKALDAFATPIKKGGVLHIDENDGCWWYEEYASPDSIRSHVLNGHVFALEGIYKFYMHTKDPAVLEIFNKGLNELKSHLHEYGFKRRWKNVRFTGKLPRFEALKIIYLCDATMMPYEESYGYISYFSTRKVKDYLSLGKPIIMTEVREAYLLPNENVLLPEPGNAKDLAKKIKKFYQIRSCKNQ